MSREPRDTRSYTKRRAVILDWLKAGGIGTATQVAAAVEMHREHVYSALRNLEATGDAKRLGKVKVISLDGRRVPDADLWGSANARPAKLPAEVHHMRSLTLVEKALASRHPLQTLWNGARP